MVPRQYLALVIAGFFGDANIEIIIFLAIFQVLLPPVFLLVGNLLTVSILAHNICDVFTKLLNEIWSNEFTLHRQVVSHNLGSALECETFVEDPVELCLIFYLHCLDVFR